MRLRDLDARFVGQWRIQDGHYHYEEVDNFVGAQGVQFQCPRCAQGKELQEEDGRRFFIGVHSVLCWFKTPIGADPVPDEILPGPGRWNPSGTSLDDLTFVPPGAVSVWLTSGCGWHGHVENGEAKLD